MVDAPARWIVATSADSASTEAARASASRLAALQLELVLVSAENQRLLQAIELGRKQLDEAMLEVVRSKAKLGSLGSRAEAATALAESESLAKTLQSRSASITQESGYRAAERMLALGNQEFKSENFGGAYYLASNARTGFAVLVTRTATAVPPAWTESSARRQSPTRWCRRCATAASWWQRFGGRTGYCPLRWSGAACGRTAGMC